MNKFCSVACATAGRNDLRSPEFIEVASKLWDDGYSMAQVGTLLGVSKSVISGIVWRNNFTPAHLRGRVTA